MMFVVVITLLITSGAVVLMMYRSNRQAQISDVQNIAKNISMELNKNSNDESYIQQISGGLKSVRFTLIANDGKVIYDSYTSADTMENHSDREEVIHALEFGEGEYERHSDSLDKVYYYYALSLSDGSIIRVSKATSSMYAMMKTAVPFIILELIIISLLSMLVTKKLTRKIVEPIENKNLLSDLDSPYTELDSYFQTMRKQKKQIEEQGGLLKEADMTIQTILDSMLEGFIIIDDKDKILLANTSANKIFNVDVLYGKSITLFLKDYALFSQENRKYASLKIQGRVYKLYINEKELDSKMVSTILFIDNTSEEFAKKQREEFSANVSHELKTPLTSIRGLGELQAAGLVDESDVTLFGEKIVRQSNRLIELIDQTIQLSKFDEAKIEEVFGLVDMHELSLKVKSILDEKALEKEIVIDCNVHGIIEGSEKMLDEMLFNLIDNAIIYGDISSKIKISSIETEDMLEITVENTGETLPAEVLPHLFERYYRVDSSRSKKSGGTGLGLSIVKHIVEYHGGDVHVESSNTTRFIVRLPKTH